MSRLKFSSAKPNPPGKPIAVFLPPEFEGHSLNHITSIQRWRTTLTGRPLPGAKIDELIITVIPILLGGGIPLFGELPERMEFDYVKTEIFLNEMVQNHYRRKKYP